jgi:hypothetical protein
VSSDDNELEILLGRIGNRDPRESLINEVLRATRQAGVEPGSTTGRRGGPGSGRSAFGRGRTAFSRSRLFAAERRVVVKARVVRHPGRAFRSAPLSAHVAYLERNGVTRDGEKGRLFGAAEDRAAAAAFARRSLNDRHHFRFVITPDDAAGMTDLRAIYTRPGAQMESDPGTRLDWVGIAHWNTDNPHGHLVVRGVAGDGSDVVISRDYLSHGLR